MAKYKVNIGGFVSTYRERTLIVYADSVDEAEEKAEAKFMELQQQRPGNMCDEGTVNWVEEVGR